MTKLAANDPWLKPYEERIRRRMEFTHARERSITQGGDIPLEQFADGYLHYGLHHDKEKGCWILREFLPGAQSVHLIGSFNNWQTMSVWKLKRVDDYGNWEICISDKAMRHGDFYRLFVHWGYGSGERIPAWATRVVQDPSTGIFSAQVWAPEDSYTFRHARPARTEEPLMIYECHIGMSSEEGKVSSYREFQEKVLPRIIDLGYNAIQIMAIQEHPYYGSFGYHVSSFFAPSSRFGTPDELKALIDAAHAAGLKVIMDLVHSHAVRNEVEGLACYDGSRTLFFHEVHVVTIPLGTRCASTTGATTSSTSFSPTVSTGWRSSSSTASALTASPRCCTTTTASASASPRTLTTSMVIRMPMLWRTSRWPIADP